MIRTAPAILPPVETTSVEVFGPFDYSSLPTEKATRAREAVAYIGPRLRSATATMLEVGSKLLKVKEDLEHGQFTAWVEAEFPFTIRSAQNYMRDAEALASKSESVSYLPVNTVHALARADAHTRDLVLCEMERATGEGRKLGEDAVASLLAKGRDREEQAKVERRKPDIEKDAETAHRPVEMEVVTRPPLDGWGGGVAGYLRGAEGGLGRGRSASRLQPLAFRLRRY